MKPPRPGTRFRGWVRAGTTRHAPSTYTFGVQLISAGTTTPYPTQVTFTKLRIFVVPASSTISLNLASDGVDLADYQAVRPYLSGAKLAGTSRD